MYAHTTNQQQHCDYVIHACIVNEHKTKDVRGQEPSCLFASLTFFDHFPLLTMIDPTNIYM